MLATSVKSSQHRHRQPQNTAISLHYLDQQVNNNDNSAQNKRIISFEELNFNPPTFINHSTKKISNSQIKSIGSMQGIHIPNSDIKTPSAKYINQNYQSSYSLGKQHSHSQLQHLGTISNSKQSINMISETKEGYNNQLKSINRDVYNQQASLHWEDAPAKQRQRMTLKKIVDGSSTELLDNKEKTNTNRSNNNNVLVIQDRFIDTKEQVRQNLIKSSNLIRNVSNARLHLASQQHRAITTAAAVSGQSTNKQYYLGMQSAKSRTEVAIADEIYPETAQKRHNSGNNIQLQQLGSFNQIHQQNLNEGDNYVPIDDQFQPVQATTKTTILKKPSSRHQPSRMKFSIVTQPSPSRSFLTTPINGTRNIGSDSVVNNNTTLNQARPFTSESSLSQMSQHKYYMGKLDKEYTAKMMMTMNSKNNQNLHNHNKNNTQDNHHSSQHSENNEIIPYQAIKYKQMNQAESFALTQNLSQSQSRFLQRSLNYLGDTLPVVPSSQIQLNQSGLEQNPMKGNSERKKVIKFSLENNNNLEDEQTENSIKIPIQKLLSNEKHGILTNGNIHITEGTIRRDTDNVKEESEKSEEVTLNGSDSEQEGDNINNNNRNIRKKRQKTSAERQRERDRKDKQNQESLQKLISFTEITSGNRNQTEKNNQENHNLLHANSPSQIVNINSDIKFDEATIKKYESQGGINIEKEIMEQKVNKQRTHQKEVAQLISTIQNNAMENYQNHNRMEQSQAFKMMERKSKILEENKQIKKQQFEENLLALKDKNQYEGVDIEQLETEFATGGKFSQKNYNNLKINRNCKRTRQQISDIFRNTIKLLQRLNIDPKEVMTTKVFSIKPFEKENSHQFFERVKANDYDQVAFLLKYSKYLVYDYDYLFMTPLHWCCKRGFYKMAKLLLQYNSDLDAEDMIGRTPLFFAVEQNFEDIIELLLVNKASPYKTKYVDYQAIAKTYVVEKMLSVCRRLHWAIKLNPNPNKAEQWRKEIQVVYAIRQQEQTKEEELKKKKALH